MCVLQCSDSVKMNLFSPTVKDFRRRKRSSVPGPESDLGLCHRAIVPSGLVFILRNYETSGMVTLTS